MSMKQSSKQILLSLLIFLIPCWYAVILTGLPTSVYAQDGWKRGSIVGLSQGTCIREGPGFNYRAHTRVPENDWKVMVIDGPRMADGLVWYDTSRKEAGDPSGGTGWVTQDQTDTNCDNGIATVQPPVPTTVNPGNGPVNPPTVPGIEDLIRQAKEWWYQQTALVKWSIAVLALLLVFSVWRRAGGIVIEFISAVFSAALIWVLLDLTRSFWQETWESLARPVFAGDTPDLALLLGVLPLVAWGFALISRLFRGRS